MFNHSDVDFQVAAGDRIAQLILEKVSTPPVICIQEGELSQTQRGDGGFGSTNNKLPE